jgi:cytochrome c553
MQRYCLAAAVLAAAVVLAPAPASANSTQVLIAHGLVTQAQGRGADLFFRETFQGNGRTCGTCHPVDNNQTIEPAFIATLPSSDPLFIAEKPANQGGVPGLEIPVLMRQFGLILENVDGLQNPTVKFVMRGVPHSLSLATSITATTGFPQPQATGWSGDGSPDGTLLQFSAGAVKQHFTKTLARNAGDFRPPTATELQNMQAFMLAVGRTNELNLANVSLTDAGADVGRRIFRNSGTDPSVGVGRCNNCHGNAGANASFGDQANRNFDTGVEEVPHPGRAVQSFPFDGGLGQQLNNEGTFGDGTFNTAGLVEAADTPPFFHNNVIDTLENAVAFYSSQFFNQSPAAAAGTINLTPTESDQVAAFLRVVNASFNLAISLQRNNAAASLENSSNNGCGGGGGGDVASFALDGGGGECTDSINGGFDDVDGKRETVNTLLLLANVEGADAIEVLTARGLHSSAVSLIQSGITKNDQAIAENSSSQRLLLIQSAAADFSQAKAQFGSGLNFTMGQGNLLF